MKTKYILILFISTFMFLSCGKRAGYNYFEKGKRSKNRVWMESKPVGMVRIEGTSFAMGMNDEDPFHTLSADTKTVSVESFWMDETEITNNEYRQFVQWVLDSITRKTLGEFDDRYLISEDKKGNIIEPPLINWRQKIDYQDPEVQDALEGIYYPENERIDGKRIDVRRLKYEWSEVDLRQAAYVNYNPEIGEYDGFIYDKKGEYKDVEDRSDFIISDGTYVYPDTLVWLRDFTYSNNEPLARMYFTHPGYDTYPVVGVTWKQAVAFCKWRTQMLENAIAGTKRKSDFKIQEFRLPSEAEWEVAARGKINSEIYPWGGPYIRSQKGCFLANFKPMRGNYAADGFTTTAPVGSYKPNDYGLRDMAGNVAEWTSSAYSPASYKLVHDLNPNYQYNTREGEGKVMKRKVIRGGSWKDVKAYLQVGARAFEYEDEPRSYIGFRCVKTYVGK